MISRLFRTKSIEQILADADHPDHRLKKTLTAWDLTALGIGAIIGTGIFVLIGTAIVGDAHRPGAGPGIILSFVLSGLTCAFAALCYAEFSTMIPVAGSAYTYSYATLGEFLAWITGWNLILEYGVACVAVAIGWSGYFNNLLRLAGIELPHWATHPPGGPDGGVANFPAAIIVLLVTIILVIGIKESARATGIIVCLKLAVILFFIAVGTPAVNTDNWTPFMPQGFAGVGAAAAIVFFAYIGFDAISTTAEEAKNPQRDLPIGIIASLSICTILYIAVAAVLTGLIPSVTGRHPCAGGRSAEYGGLQVGSGDCGDRGRGRNYQRSRRDDAGSDPGILCHVARPPLEPLAFNRASALWHASLCHHSHRYRRGHARCPDSHRRRGGHDEHRHSLCLCPGLYRCRDPALHETQPAPPIPASVHAGRPHSGHAGLPRPNELSPMGDLDSIRRLDLHRHCGLYGIRPETQQTGRPFLLKATFQNVRCKIEGVSSIRLRAEPPGLEQEPVWC